MDRLKQWLDTTPFKDFDIAVASADASFRKYYRLTKENKTYIAMDSSLEKDSLEPFLYVTRKLHDAAVNAPEIYEKNLELGYLVIEDFGSIQYFNLLDSSNFKTLYSNAIDTIVSMQKTDPSQLPLYDKAFLHFEMNLMKEWYLQGLLKQTLTFAQEEILQKSLEHISSVVLTQPQNIFVHRDFHSRNIMQKTNGSIGVIDYQDAMNGALTYDLVSLLKDCYIEFPREEIIALALEFKNKCGVVTDDAEFIKWFDFMGLQRHIKVLGVFSRLFLRDAKEGYLKDIPLTLKYTLEAASLYEETKPLAALLKELT